MRDGQELKVRAGYDVLCVLPSNMFPQSSVSDMGGFRCWKDE